MSSNEAVRFDGKVYATNVVGQACSLDTPWLAGNDLDLVKPP